jgi:uncharacterized protein DUF2252
VPCGGVDGLEFAARGALTMVVTRICGPAARWLSAVVMTAAVAWAGSGEGLLPEDRAALAVDPASPALAANPELRRRLAEGPHDFFRYVNGPFREVLCRRLVPEGRSHVDVTLHGDPHVEQYSVTNEGRGLADFDEATIGPAVLDLVRFATSLRLAMSERGWDGADDLVRVFLAGYADALRNPRRLPPEPRIVARLRARFDPNRNDALARAEGLMLPFPPDKAPSDETLALTARRLAQVSGWPEASFKVKRLGAHRMGIGSADAEKYLLRIEGKTPSPEDDVILEVKEVQPSAGGACVHGEPGPDRILKGGSQLAYQAFQYAGGITLEGHSFWFHAWTDNYVEVDIRRDLQSLAELTEIARDVGFQLGRGHPDVRGGKASKRLRAALTADLPHEDVLGESLVMAQATTEAWQRYRERLGEPGHAGGAAGRQ